MPSKQSFIPAIQEYGASKKNYVATTRFNNKTWSENQEYVKKNGKIGCIYPVPEPNGQNIHPDAFLIVLEMNNEQNRIMGVGLVKNKPIYNKYHVYSDSKYNQYAYLGKYRIDRDEMSEMEENIMQVFDILCFTGARHLKRLMGLKTFPIDILYKCSKILDIVDFLSDMFKRRF